MFILSNLIDNQTRQTGCTHNWAASSEFVTYRLCEQWAKRNLQTESQIPAPPLNGCACAVKICHDGMLEDTNSLDAPHMRASYLTCTVDVVMECSDWYKQIHHPINEILDDYVTIQEKKKKKKKNASNVTWAVLSNLSGHQASLNETNKLLNPYLHSRLFHSYQLDGSISKFRGVCCTVLFSLYFE